MNRRDALKAIATTSLISPFLSGNISKAVDLPPEVVAFVDPRHVSVIPREERLMMYWKEFCEEMLQLNPLKEAKEIIRQGKLEYLELLKIVRNQEKENHGK